MRRPRRLSLSLLVLSVVAACDEPGPRRIGAASPGPVAFGRYDPPPPPPPPPVDPMAEVEGVPEPEQLQDWLIPYGPRREALTAAYLAAHVGPHAVTGDDAADSRMVPRVIVLHWTAQGSARSAWFTFQPERSPDRRYSEGAKALNISAHFIVDRKGVIFRLMEETRVGRHTIGLNHLSVGVENVGDGKRYPLTAAQVQSNADLVRYLKARFPSITHLIGHFEYRAFEHAGHDYFQEHDTRRRTRKVDPGADFMAAVRAEVADLGLLGPPEPPAAEPD